MNLSQETDEKRLMLLRAAAEHMSKKFTMKVQEVKLLWSSIFGT